MKKTKRLFGLFFMVFTLIAGSLNVFAATADIESKYGITEEQVIQAVEGWVGQLATMSEEELSAYKDSDEMVATWITCTEGAGSFVSVLGEKASYEITDGGFVAYIPVKMENKEINVKMIFDASTGGVAVTFSAEGAKGAMSLGEIFKKAGLNTLLGMGTVFVMLIFISILIWLLGFVPKLMDNRKAAAKEEVVGETPAVFEQIIAKEETADTELVAVIAAAVAAASGTSTDSFVVRSIRKVKRS